MSNDNKIVCCTPTGIISYPHILEGFQTSNGVKRQAQLFVCPNGEIQPGVSDGMKKKEQALFDKLVQAVDSVGKSAFKDFEITPYSSQGNKYNHPFISVDDLGEKKQHKFDTAKESIHGSLLGRGLVRLISKSSFEINRNLCVGPDGKTLLSDQELKDIQGGDLCRLIVNVYSFDYKGTKGVNLGLHGVQFIRKGQPLGEGIKAALEVIDEVEVEAGDIDVNSEADLTSTEDVGKAQAAIFGRR